MGSFSKRHWKFIIIQNFKKNLYNIIYTVLSLLLGPFVLFNILDTSLLERNFSFMDFMIFMIPLIVIGLLRLVYLLFFYEYKK
jgi:prolipoprotein diacylglyceryltransferase